MNTVDPGQWRQLQELFWAARELAPAARGALLDERCRGGPTLRREVDALLASHDSWIPGDDTWAADATELDEDLVGQRLQRYRIERLVGRGSMGVVYEAWQEGVERPVALKVIRPSTEAVDHDFAALLHARFLKEVQILGRLDHPGVVPIHQMEWDAAGHPFFSMRLVRGRSLTEIIDGVRSDRDRQRCLDILRRVCETMAFAHARGVVHRDLKPSHAMVGEFGEVYVLDWGLAKLLDPTDEFSRPLRGGDDRGSPLMTMEGEVVGTAAYMSPEQAEGSNELVGTASDVYAIGAILYHVLTGLPPYIEPDETSVSTREVLVRLRRGAPVDVAERDRKVAPELASICNRAMERDPADRYTSIQELADDLEAFTGKRVVRAHRTGPLIELRKWIARNRGVALTIGFSGLLLIGGSVASAVTLAASDKEARESLSRFDMVSSAIELRDLESIAPTLYPAWPDTAPALRSFLARADRLAEELPHLETLLAELRTGASPWTEEEQRHDRDSHASKADYDYSCLLEESLRMTLQAIHPAEREKVERNLAQAGEDVRTLGAQVAVRRTYSLADPKQQFLHDTLAQLAPDLRAFLDPAKGARADVRARLAWAESVRERTIERPAAQWAEAIAAIRRSDGVSASELYRGLEIVPQLGLVPMGMDPVTKLWEFAHLRSGAPGAEIPVRDAATGALQVTEESGIVFVLLPGGRFTMGVQRTDPTKPHYDPDADKSHGPPHRVRLDPFFMAKHELSQAQWMRLNGGENPSRLGRDHDTTTFNPVHNVSWNDCTELLARYMLVLPTEARWEYACRAGTDSIWWTGDDEAEVLRAENMKGSVPEGKERPRTIQTGPPNPFGLHHMHGNLHEWCMDHTSFGYWVPARPGDGLRVFAADRSHIFRGSSWVRAPMYGSSAGRNYVDGEFRELLLGVRAARELQR